jgi:hypothetical protein
MERRQLLKAAPAALLLAGTAGVAGPAVAAPPARSVGEDAPDILNALYRWALGYDSQDRVLMMTGFTDDPTFIFRSHTGAVATFEGLDEVFGLFDNALTEQDEAGDQRRHVNSNSLIEKADRRTANVTTYLTLISINLNDPNRALRVVTTGVYRDKVVKGRDGVWRIEVRDLTLDGPSA